MSTRNTSAGPRLSSGWVGVLLLSILIFSVPLPARAELWLAGSMTDAGSRPRLVMTETMKETVRERAMRTEYAWLLRQIVDWSEQDYPLDDTSISNEIRKAQVAKACAFGAYLGIGYEEDAGAMTLTDAQRADLADKSLKYLENMTTESRAKGIYPTDDINTAEELLLYAQSYDLLLAYGVASDGRETLARQNLADLAADLYADFEIENYTPLRAYVNNHRGKSSSAIGAAAIALNGLEFEKKREDGRYSLHNWVTFAMRYVDLTFFDIGTDWEGGYQESGSYLAYAGRNVFPFIRAWHYYTDAADWSVDPLDPLVPPYFLFDQQEPYTVTDFWTRPLLSEMLDWSGKLAQPDFTFPAFDDCTPGGRVPYGFFVNADFLNASHYRWLWENQKGGRNTGGMLAACELLAAFDDTIVSAAPEAWEAKDAVLPVAGNVVWRSSWEWDAVYLLLLAEHGKAAGVARNRWGEDIEGVAGHEHADPGSFLLWAYGEPLAIDAGYLGWDAHDAVNKPQNHNIVLVDGKGPLATRMTIPSFTIGEDGKMVVTTPEVEGGWAPGGDGEAWLLRAISTEDGFDRLQAADIVTEYHVKAPSVDIRRRALFLDRRFVVIYDRIRPTDGRAHDLTFQLHGHGGPEMDSGDFEPTEFGGRWIREKASLEAFVFSDHAPDFRIRQASHDSLDEFVWLEKKHSALDAVIHVEPNEVGRFLAVLIPRRRTDGAESPMTTEIYEEDGQAPYGMSFSDSERGWTVVLGDRDVELSAGPLNFQGDLAVYGSMDGKSDSAYLLGAIRLSLGEDPVFTSESGPLSLWWERNESGLFRGSALAMAEDGSLPRFQLEWPSIARTGGLCEAEIMPDFVTLTAVPDAPFHLSESSEELPMPGDPPHVLQAHNAHGEALSDGEPPVFEIYDELCLFDRAADCPDHASDPERWTLARRPQFSRAELVRTPDDADCPARLTPDYPGEYVIEYTADSRVPISGERLMLTAVGQPRLYREEADGDEEADEDMEWEGETEIDGDFEGGDGEIAEHRTDGDEESELPLADGDDSASPVRSHGSGGGCRNVPQKPPVFPWFSFLTLFLIYRKRKKRSLQ